MGRWRESNIEKEKEIEANREICKVHLIYLLLYSFYFDHGLLHKKITSFPLRPWICLCRSLGSNSNKLTHKIAQSLYISYKCFLLFSCSFSLSVCVFGVFFQLLFISVVVLFDFVCVQMWIRYRSGCSNMKFVLHVTFYYLIR